MGAGCATAHGAPSTPTAPPTAAAHAVTAAFEAPTPSAPTFDGVLSHRADLVLTLHPPAIARDPVYGPLFRRASELASAYAGPTNLGTTALALVERTEEVVIAETDKGKEAVVVLRGVPAAVDALEVVDTFGRPIWRVVHGDTRGSSRELAPTGTEDAALFVLPGLVWIIASGPAVARVRAALTNGLAKDALLGDETSLVLLSLPGDALPQLKQGELATVGAGLLRIELEMMSGASGLVVAKLAYTDTQRAASAEGTVLSVTLAFRHRLEEAIQARDGHALSPAAPAPPPSPPTSGQRAGGLDWLGAAKVDREEKTVVVRAPLPRRWLDTLTRADVSAPAP